MRVERWNDLSEVPDGFGPSVVAIGNFDGVHRGHRSVLTRLVRLARSRGAAAAAITFDPHPVHVLRPQEAPPLLTGRELRLELLEGTGLDALLVMPFTLELASWSPERFVRDVIVECLGAAAVVVGHDIRFGVRNSGDLGTMRELGARYDFEVVVLDDVLGPVPGHESQEEAHRRWSSSWTRELVAAGDVAAAAEVLGRPHRVDGLVVHGDHRGRELGFPTANLDQDAVGMVPADGVYAGWMERLDLGQHAVDRVLPVAISVGTNPTFDGRQRRVEAHVLDRSDLVLYGERVALSFVARLRETVRFSGTQALVAQMALDVEQARGLLGAAPAPTGD